MPITNSNTVISDKTFLSMMDKEGYRWTRKTFTRPRGGKLFRDTPEGAELKQRTEDQIKLGNLHNRSEIITLPNGREQFVIYACWTSKEAYHEFEQWYMDNMKQKVVEFEKANDIIHEYNVQAFESISTVDEHLRKSFIEKIAFRKNIHVFDQERIPEKTIIEKILKDAFEYTPILQSVYPFHVKVWGPEYKEMKKQLVVRSVCGRKQEDFRKGGIYEGDWKRCEEIYDRWFDKWVTSGGVPHELEGYAFNQQIVAPYLISWHPVPVLPTQSQLDQGYIERRPYNNGNVNEGLMKDNVYIGASMHSYAMSILAANYGLNASFTRCFITNTEPADNIPDAVKPIFTTEKDPSYGKVPFVLGIGYRHPLDKQVGDANYKIKPGFDEINFWQ